MSQEERVKYDNGYYKEMLEKGLEFQDFVTTELYRRGIVMVGYASRRYQRQKGENMLGAEIKLDQRFRQTGNLYLEIAEKSHPDNPRYVPSGIMRRDNSWLFVIGDTQGVYIFDTKRLRLIRSCYRTVKTPTSIAHLMPLREAEKHCVRKIGFVPTAPTDLPKSKILTKQKPAKQIPLFAGGVA